MAKDSFIPIYQRLTDFYKQRILSQQFKPGSQIDSINRIMSRHSVSRETAKIVLKKLAEEGLVVQMAGKGTFVTHQVDTRKIWGMVIPFFSSNMEQLIINLMEEAKKRGRQFDYYIHYNNADEEIRLVGSLIRNGYEAIVVVPNYDETLTAEFYRKLIAGNTNVILADNTMAGSYFKYVVQSYDLGVKRAMDYLVGQNDGNLMLVKNATWKGRNMVHEFMEQTLKSLCQISYPDREVFVIDQNRQLSFDMLKENRIGGILCCIDTDAIKVFGRLKRWGLTVPGAISLVNYGNTELIEFFEPGITAIDCQYCEMAKKISELIDLGKEASPMEQYVFQPKLVIRET